VVVAWSWWKSPLAPWDLDDHGGFGWVFGVFSGIHFVGLVQQWEKPPGKKSNRRYMLSGDPHFTKFTKLVSPYMDVGQNGRPLMGPQM
jgi:hypothetical protein